MAALFGVIGTVASVGGSAMSSAAARKAGKAGQQAKEYEATQYERQAVSSIASAQRNMLDERRRKELVISRAQALAAFGGGGVHDVTVQNIIADIDNEGSYREAVALYQGEEESRKLNEAARLARIEGRVIRKGGQAQAKAYAAQGVATAAQGFSSLYTKYSQNTNTTKYNTLSSGTGTN